MSSEIRTSDGDLTKIFAAIVAAQSKMKDPAKDTKGQVGTAVRMYADLGSVLDACRDALWDNKLAVLQFPGDIIGSTICVATRIVHESGEWIESTIQMPFGGGQSGAQAVGSAITYARRYSLMAILGLAPEDDDGAAASVQPQRQQARQRSGGAAVSEVRSDRPHNGEPDEADRLWAQFRAAPQTFAPLMQQMGVKTAVTLNALRSDALMRSLLTEAIASTPSH